MAFVTILSDFPIIFSKSQTPAVRKSKSQAIDVITKQWEANFGSQITSSQLLKKVNNMKSRLKKKTDINRTGNRKIVLVDWEKVLLEIMDGDTNPVITKIPGAASIGVSQMDNYTKPTYPESTSKSQDLPEGPPSKSRKISPLDEYETDITKKLSNSELQRLVLLTQLKVLNMKKEKLRQQLNQEVDHSPPNIDSNSSNVTNDNNGNTYLNL